MIEKKDKYGKRYCEVTDEEIKTLNVKGYFLGSDRKKLIPPPDCKHEFVITWGMPRNIKACKHCIYWEFTMQPPTQCSDAGAQA